MAFKVRSGECVSILPGECVSILPSIHNIAEATHYRLLAERRALQAEERAMRAEFRALKAEADGRILRAENRALLAEYRLRHAEAILSYSHPKAVENQTSESMEYQTSESITRMNRKKKKKNPRYWFPWLQTKAVAVGDDVFRHIMTFMEERAMFKFRRVNRVCYHLFYSRENYNDTGLVMNLAARGRQFSKIKTLALPKLTTDELCCITQLQFPKLENISMPFLEPHEMRFLPSHSTLKTLSEVSSAHSITRERFPSLLVLKICKPQNGRLRGLHPHDKIEALDLNCNLDEQGYNNITREKFPSLCSVQLYESRDLGQETNYFAWLDFTARLGASKIILHLV